MLLCAKGSFLTSLSNVAGAPRDPTAALAGGGKGGRSCTGAGESASPSPTASSPAAGGLPARTRVVAGPVVTHRYGPVQVQVGVSGDRIVDVVALRLPTSHGESARISKRAEPKLRAEALVAQSADIHTVSGATLTSNAYRSSLQAALDAAGGHWGCPQPRRSP